MPLELFLGGKESYYKKYNNIASFNTVKAAIPLIRKYLATDEILVPHYLCPNVIKELEGNFKNISFYNIDKDLLPSISELTSKTVYIVNYFGVMDKRLNSFIKKHKDTTFIIDNAHSFYSKPVMRDNAFNLYSCKKFFGVPDGGYLISKNSISSPYKKTVSNTIANYLIKSLEEGTNSCYLEKKRVDEYINCNYSGISIFSEKLLSCIDYKKIREIRKSNFKIYDDAFGAMNRIKCEQDSAPYVYPLNVGKNIKKELVSEKIYVPTLWAQLLTDEYKGTYEQDLTENTLFLPLDQRYVKEDIEYIIKRVISCIKKAR